MGIEDKSFRAGGRTKIAASPVRDESPDPDERSAKKHESIEDEDTRPTDDVTAHLDK